MALRTNFGPFFFQAEDGIRDADVTEFRRVLFRSIPVHINESSVQEIMERLLDDMKQDVPGQSFSQFDVLAKSLAKTMAIKVGATLTEEEQEHLINQLFACKEPTLSPTNRRLLITLDIDYLDNKFI